MTVIVDTGGGGTAGNFCPPSPSDLAGQVNNLITRVETLERIVAELQGQDVTATQLSDLSQQVGWVYDVTYMGIPGWIQTEAGTLIPPPGVSLSSLGILIPGLGGNPSQLIGVDSDGNPTFSITSNGTTTGGGGGGAMKSAMFSNFGSGDDTFTGSFANVTIDTTFYDDIGVTLSSNTITGIPSGYYLVSASYSINSLTNTGTLDVAARLNGTDEIIKDKIKITLVSGSVWNEAPNMLLTGGTYIYSSNPVSLQISGSASTGTVTGRLESLTLVQLNTTAAPP